MSPKNLVNHWLAWTVLAFTVAGCGGKTKVDPKKNTPAQKNAEARSVADSSGPEALPESPKSQADESPKASPEKPALSPEELAEVPEETAEGDRIVYLASVKQGAELISLERYTIRVRDTKTWEVTNEMEARGTLAFSSDGKYVAWPSRSDSIIEVYELSSKDLVCVLGGTSHEIVSLEFSPDSKLLAAGDELAGIHVWKLPAQNPGTQ